MLLVFGLEVDRFCIWVSEAGDAAAASRGGRESGLAGAEPL